ncbi:hypothetical protein [Sandaracinus amylolyticus]|uniref:hypothetical protein n=1 Tax=Sandaracinus amylolyticus TaxID=927083 RepID=UPI001F2A9F2C|nr:hypothetical protein [Sandaracinus amylolyticus]UJR85846.1 Hypothetical protein I5071_79260 [Sandaracinus amylolyticus]
MSSNVRRTLGALATLALFVVALALAARVHLSLPAGRRAAADALEALISREIPGTMRIGAIDELRTDYVRARDVVFETPEGEEALRFRRIELDPDVRRFLREGAIATRSARIQGAVLRMIEREGEDGLGLERAFDDDDEGSGGEEQGRGVTLDLANVAFHDLDSEWRIGELPEMHLDDASGIARFYTDDQGQIAMRFDRIRGEARLPMDLRVDVERASGRIRTGWRQLGLFEMRLAVMGSEVDLDLHLVDGEGGVRPRVHSDTEPGSLAMLAMLGVELVTTVAGAPDAVQVDDDSAGPDEGAK